MNSVNKLIKNIREHPEEWHFEEHTAINNKRNIEIWISNGITFCCPYIINGSKVDKMSNWSLLDRYKVWRELKKIPNYLLDKQL